MTSLAAQLHNLQTTQTDLYDQQRRPVSVLVPAAEAKQLSRDAFYKIGRNGFEELLPIPGFEEFSGLFCEDSQNDQRAVLSAEENLKLDEKIGEFLIHLGPHLERVAALKALEWLVQRYLVHEMNIDSFIGCILPYFETQLFARLLQVVNLKRSKIWDWLERSQKSGRPLPRQNLFNQWASAEWFRNFVANSFMKQTKIVSPGNLQRYAVFFILTMEGGINILNKVTETHLTTVYRTMGICLNSKSLHTSGGMAFLLLSLSATTNLTENFVNQILKSLCKAHQRNGPLSKHMTTCVVSIVCVQDIKSLPDSINAMVLNNDKFYNEVLAISKAKNISKFITAFVTGIVRFLFSGQIDSDDVSEDFSKVVTFLETVNLSGADAKNILSIFVSSTGERMTDFRNLKSCPNFGDLMTQMDICQPACVPHEAAAELLVDPAEKEAYLESNGTFFDIESENTADEKRQMAEKKAKQNLEITNCIRLLSDSALLKANECHLVREEEYKDDFERILDILQTAHRQMKADPQSKYGKIITDLFKKNLNNVYKNVYFLSMIWGSSSQSTEHLDSFLKKWALMTANKTIDESRQEALIWMMNPSETFVSSLFSPMCESELAPETFGLIANLVRKMGPKNGHKTVSSFLPLLRGVSSYRNEIIDDAKFLPRAIKNICSDEKGYLDLLMGVITDEAVPMRIKSSLLYAISELCSFKTLLSLVPLANDIMDRIKLSNGELSNDLSVCLYYILIRISGCSVKKIGKSDVAPLLMRCLKHPEPVMNIRGKLYAPQTLVVDGDFIMRISRHDELFPRLLQCLCEMANHDDGAPIASKLRTMLSKVTVSGHVMLKVMGNTSKFSITSSVKAARAKRKKTDANNDFLDLAPWKNLRFIVELIGTFGHMSDAWVLIKPLFGHLELSLGQLSLSTKNCYGEIFHQRILTTIHLLLELTEKDLTADEIHKKVKINFSLLVQLMRTTENPDTRRRVLMILSLSTCYFPNEILQNVISIFTFMGATLIKMDDNYSIQVIHRAMDTILPPLIKSVQSNHGDLNSKLFQILEVFVVAFPDIPEHRRLPLYLQLARTIGSEHLWLLMAVTANSHVLQQQKYHSRRDSILQLCRLTAFWDSLFRHFPVIDRLNTIRQVVQFLVDIPDDKDSMKKKKLEVHTKVLEGQAYTTQNLHRLKFACVQMLISFLNSSQLHKEINKISQKECEFDFSRIYHVILDVSIPYLKEVALKGSTSTEDIEMNYWSKFENRMTELVKGLFELLPAHLLVKVILNMVWSKDLSVRYKALQVVAEKMNSKLDFFGEEQTEDLSKFVTFLADSGKRNATPDDARQMSMFTLHSVLKAFGEHIEVDLVKSVLHSTATILKKDKANSDIKLQTLLVAVEGIVILEDSAIKSSNGIISFILTNLHSILKQPSKKVDANLHILTTCLQRITKTIPHQIGDHLSAIINVLCALFYHFQNMNNNVLTECLVSTQCQVLSLEPNILLENMKEVYFLLLSDHSEYLPIFFRQLSLIMVEQEIEGLYANLRSVQKIFSLALQLGTSLNCLDEINETEGAFFKSVSDFMMRCEPEQCQENFSFIRKKCLKYIQTPIKVTFYKLCSSLASSLQVIFISFHLADDIFDDAVAILSSNNTANCEEMFTDDDCLLVDAVLDTLHNIFVHDSIEFMSRGRLSTCLTPIINQIDNVMGGSEVYKNRISNHLKPCVAQLALQCREEDFWAQLNQEMLSRIKTECKTNSMVILGTLEVFEGIVDEAGCDFVQSQLNDIMVYIAEALEIVHPEIQERTKKIFLKLEETLGESLKSYLGS